MYTLATSNSLLMATSLLKINYNKQIILINVLLLHVMHRTKVLTVI